MIDRPSLVFFLALATGGTSSPSAAFAQNVNQLSTRLTISQDTSLKQEPGRLLLVTFRHGLPIGGVRLYGNFGELRTEPDGTISRDLPAGQYSLQVEGYTGKINFAIVSEAETSITIELSEQNRLKFNSQTPTASITSPDPEMASLLEKAKTHDKKHLKADVEETVVLAPQIKGSTAALVEIRRKSSNVTDVLGAEQISRAGDSDAASSLRRVTGLTLIDGKYVYVRGLGERYSAVQMNAFNLPSPEPSRRVVPLDLFPTAILESVIVQKSYSTNLPGEFGGGLIQLQTRSLPEKFYFRASLSMQADNSSSLLGYRGGSLDNLGIDDGTRQLPSSIRAALADGKKLVQRQPGSAEGISEQELTQLGRSLPNIYNLNRTEHTPLPGISLATGNRWRILGRNLGLSGSMLYGQNTDSGERRSLGYNVGSQGRLENDFQKLSQFSEIETRVAMNFDVGIDLSKHSKIGYNTFLLRHSTDFAQIESKTSSATPTSKLESTTIEWTERQIWTHHLNGKHRLAIEKPIEITWRAGLADAQRNSPDRREYAYEQTPFARQMRSDSGGNRRTYSELNDQTLEFALKVSLPVLSDPEKLKINLGANRIEKSRKADVFRLFFASDFSGRGPVADDADPESRFQKDNIGPGKFQLQNLTDAADSYSGKQIIDAQFAMADYSYSKKWSLQVGARHEHSVQTVNTFRYFEPNQPFAQSTLSMEDFLPTYSLTWKPSQNLRGRLAYSETLARPDFRELSTVGFIDDQTGYEVQGNSNLTGTVIRNIDHRWEYYFNSDEYASVGAFYKKFENPIEVMFVPGVNRIQTFDNAQAAENFGLEIESRLSLRHLARPLRRWTVLSNLTLISSNIVLDERNRGIQTSDSRPLQGQSPYVVNFQVQYDRPFWGLYASLLYNVVGERITEVGTNGIPDTYEQPAGQLDFVASKKFAKTWTMSMRAKNLLNPAVESFQSNQLVRSFRRGRTVGVSIGAAF